MEKAAACLPPDRPVNLYQPADDDQDHGAHGQFAHMAGGFLDPSCRWPSGSGRRLRGAEFRPVRPVLTDNAQCNYCRLQT